MTTVNSGVQALETYFNNLKGEKVGVVKFQEIKDIALKDKQVDKEEAKFLMDKLSSNSYEMSTIPMVVKLIQTKDETAQAELPVAYIGRNRLTNVREVAEEFKDIKKAIPLTDENGIDEVYFKDAEGKVYVANGGDDTKGAMDLKGLKMGYVGRLGDKKVQVIHINNENNTTWEGAKSPWISTWDTLSTAGQNSIVSGLGTAATTLTSLFIGKAVLENSMKATGEQIATKVAEKAAPVIADKTAATVGVVGHAKALGTSVGATVGKTLKSVAVGVAVVGAVVGTVVAVGSVIGAYNGTTALRDYATLDMVTGQY